MLRFILPFVALSFRQLEEDEHEHHEHEHSEDEEAALKLPLCGCLATEKGFTIDCADAAAVTAAYEAVKACTDCNTDECSKNWAIVEVHHDLCLHDEVPKEVEVGFHDLEDKCPHSCLVGRKTGGLDNCPDVKCADAKTILDAISFDGCDTTCTEQCGADYKTLRYVHDTCEKDEIPDGMGKFIHDLEEPCEEYNCWAESSHCDGVTGENPTLGLADLKERAFDRCKFTEADAKLCPASAFAAAFLAFYL